MVVHTCNPNTQDRGKRSRHLRLLWAVWRDVDLGRKKGAGDEERERSSVRAVAQPVTPATLETGTGGLPIQGLKPKLKRGLGRSSVVEHLPGVSKALPSLWGQREGGLERCSVVRALAALLEDPGLIPSTLLAAYKSSLGI